MPSEPDRVFPFSTGSQAAFWMDENCDSCHKGHDGDKYHCDLQEALDEAGIIGNGTIDKAMAERIGINEQTRTRYTWRCAEFAREAPAGSTRPADLPGQGLLFGGERTS